MRKTKLEKNKNGITLIALVVTIVILLILAGVTILTLTGDNGLFTRTKEAKEKYQNSQQEENYILSKYLDFMENDNMSNNRDLYDNIDKLVLDVVSQGNILLTIEDVVNSETFMDKVVKSKSSLDYILGNKDKYLSVIVNSRVAMKKMGESTYAMDKIITDSDWTSAILQNQNAITGLDESNPILVPTMTSNNQPKGETNCSSSYSSDYDAYKVFDKNDESYWSVAKNVSYKDQYVSYKFDSSVWAYKIDVKMYVGKQNTYYVIEGSNDNSNWDIITEQIYQADTATIIPNNYNKKYQYYRLRFLSEVTQGGDGNTVVREIKIYGK